MEELRPLNVEEAIIGHLKAHGFDAYANVPKPRPREFVTVELTGGAADGVRVNRPTVAVQSWSTSRYEASELALRVDACMREIVGDNRICRAKRNSMYNYPDDEQARYQAVYDLVTY